MNVLCIRRSRNFTSYRNCLCYVLWRIYWIPWWWPWVPIKDPLNDLQFHRALKSSLYSSDTGEYTHDFECPLKVISAMENVPTADVWRNTAYIMCDETYICWVIDYSVFLKHLSVHINTLWIAIYCRKRTCVDEEKTVLCDQQCNKKRYFLHFLCLAIMTMIYGTIQLLLPAQNIFVFKLDLLYSVYWKYFCRCAIILIIQCIKAYKNNSDVTFYSDVTFIRITNKNLVFRLSLIISKWEIFAECYYLLCNCRRADPAEAVVLSTAEEREAGGCLVGTVVPGSTADQHVRARETIPVTTHSALRGVRNAIDASYVSCRRHLGRRVCQPRSFTLGMSYAHRFKAVLTVRCHHWSLSLSLNHHKPGLGARWSLMRF